MAKKAQAQVQSSNKNLKTVSIEKFKSLVDTEELTIVRSPKTSKLFVSDDNGNYYRCQQNLNLKGDLAFLIEDGDTENACLINPGEGGQQNVLKTL